MTVRTAFLTVIGFLLAGGLIGGGTGYVVGAYFADALRVQFRQLRDDALNPVQVGVGIGIPQEWMLGALAGVAVVAILAWHASRTRRPDAV
ncbi:MAG: hypothetical protein U0871_26555 [Gemmataceae bacterium]